ncbi:MAG: DUF4302 domain-containing protein [Bacteroidales bacterium]|nr:DUF4302 domain-containing protein [Bacteroidales bacterium]
MRLKNIFGYAAMAAVLAVSQSCLKDQQDIFDKTASARMQEFLENTRAVLTDAEYGWRMEYFTDYGGYNYALKFKDGQVTASSEMKPGETETSYYKLTTDDGPVLSFDTHSEILHFFATPSSSEYEGKGGDFEFIILSAEPSEIVLKGERSGYIAHLYPLTEPVDEYTVKIGEIIKKMLVLGFDCDLEGDKSYSGRFDLMERTVVFGQYDEDGIVKGEEISESFIYTETGVRLYQPLDVNGYSFSVFDVAEVPGTIGTDNSKAVLTAKAIPDDYIRFDQIPGTYSMSAGGRTYTVELRVYDEFFHEFEVFGIGNYQIFMQYNVNNGHLTVDSQFIHVGDELCPNGDFYVTLMGCDSDGSLTTAYNMNGIWDGKSIDTPTFNFVSGTETANVTGFLLWNFNSTEGFGGQYSGEYEPNSLRPLTRMSKIK